VVHAFYVKQTEGAEIPKLTELKEDPGEAFELLCTI
jgi:hypothetical protein